MRSIGLLVALVVGALVFQPVIAIAQPYAEATAAALNSATVSQIDPVAATVTETSSDGTSTAKAYADLSLGKMGASVTGGGSAVGLFSDQLTFDTGGASQVVVPFQVAIDGSYNATASGSAQSYFNMGLNGQGAILQVVGRFGPVGDLMTVPIFNQTVVQDIALGSFTSPGFTADLVVNNGDVFDFTMALSAFKEADFYHTATINFDLPVGVNFSSASGVFLSAVQSPVPEPTTWQLMLLGFGGIGWVLRRYPRANAAVRLLPSTVGCSQGGIGRVS
jgi:hypothetical protein